MRGLCRLIFMLRFYVCSSINQYNVFSLPSLSAVAIRQQQSTKKTWKKTFLSLVFVVFSLQPSPSCLIKEKILMLANVRFISFPHHPLAPTCVRGRKSKYLEGGALCPLRVKCFHKHPTFINFLRQFYDVGMEKFSTLVRFAVCRRGMKNLLQSFSTYDSIT